MDEVLSACDVAQLLKQRRFLEQRTSVSIRGTITSLSRIIKIKTDLLFVLEIDSCALILVKDFKLEWHSQLEPGGTYLFHNMMITTIERGISQPKAVLLAWNNSCLTELTPNSDIATVSLDCWLTARGITSVKPHIGECDDHRCQNGTGDNWINYEGIVTSTHDAKDGLYILDDKIRLLCCDVDLDLNSAVSISNAHLIQLRSLAYLVCCVRSLVRVKGTSNNSNLHGEDRLFHQPKVMKTDSAGLKSFFRKNEMKLKEMLAALELRDCLVVLKRSHGVATRTVKRLLTEGLLWQVRKRHNGPLDAFINHDGSCSHTENNANTCEIPEVLSFSNLKLEVSTELDRSKESKEKDSVDPHRGYSYSARCKFFHKNSDKILVGTIQTNCKGQLSFCDGRDELPLLVLSDSVHIDSSQDTQCYSIDREGNKPTSHWCSPSCVSDTKFGEHISCPVLDSCLLDKLICVKEFHIVIEQNSSFSLQSCERKLIYLAFSLQSCVLLDEASDPLNTGEVGSSNKPVKNQSCLIQVTSKLPLRVNSSGQDLEFEIVGHSAGVKDSKNIQPEPVSSKDASSESERQRENVSANVRMPPVHDKTGSFQGEKFVQCSYDWTDSKPVSVIFSGPLCKWYHLISVGKLYVLETTQSNLVPRFFSGQLQSAARRCKVRQQIRAPQDMKVQRESRPAHGVRQNLTQLSLSSIKDVLSHNFSDYVVSFQGKVESRVTSKSAFADPEFKHKDDCNFVMSNICLQVRELSRDSATDGAIISVYIDAPKNVYSLGLVPGAIIHFTNLERKVSRAGNVYCRLTVVSSLQVLMLLPVDDHPRPDTLDRSHKAPVVSDLPQALLVDLWLLDPAACLPVYNTAVSIRERGGGTTMPPGAGLWSVQCCICTVFKLSIKVVCSLCKGAVLDGECQSRGCSNAGHPLLLTHAIVLVDDGSGQARVTFRDPSLVARLLTLTEEQWGDVTSGLSGCSELLLTKGKEVPEVPVAQLLRSLCWSPMVLRPCRMAVCRARNSPNQHTVDSMAADEFELKEIIIAKTALNSWSLPLLSLDCFALEELC